MTKPVPKYPHIFRKNKTPIIEAEKLTEVSVDCNNNIR